MRVVSHGIGSVAGALVYAAASVGQVTIQAGPFVDDTTGHTYYRLTGSTDVNAYRQFAQNLGGYLAQINDADENSFIDNTVLGSNTAYIGFTDEAQEGTFRWDSGQFPGYTRWDDDEPNNDGNEDYATMRSNGRWNDVSNGEANRAIAEVSGNDTCGYATPITIDGPMVVVNLGTATNDANERNHCSREWGFWFSDAIWLRFTGNGRPVTITTCDPVSGFDTALQVLRGTCALARCIGADNDGGCFSRAAVTVFTEAGAQHYVLVRGYNGDRGPFAVAGVRAFTLAGPAVTLTDKRFRDRRPFYRTTEPVYWHDAQAYAAARGGNLASILSAAERNWVRGNYAGELFVGLTDAANEGTFVWTSGEPLGFAEWAPNEPNDQSANEDYVVMAGPVGLLNDVPGNFLRTAIVEFANNLPCHGAIQLIAPETYTAPYFPGSLTGDETACGGVAARGMWFQFTGSGQVMTVSTCDPATTMDTTLRVFSGECEGLACVGGNDDAGGTCGTRSRVTFLSQAGATYWVCVGKSGDANAAAGDQAAVTVGNGTLCPADIDGNGIVNSTDVSMFINIWFDDQANGTLNADFNADGVSNSTDVSDLINAYFAAGPECL